ncbi:hypothetical protein [Polyangium aurulentum]|uniref:hypothetical protein n=1 Tax=Polyangium aurulentum TaxID=2567896 RepID=UPI0010ADC7B3|nr:hypothetical protein [Polyangium aurulentum]UQA57609.1 hypothetical protein E8A73_041070 [Polyangium aurulentum]
MDARALWALSGLAAGVCGCFVVVDVNEGGCDDASRCSARSDHLWSVIAIEDRVSPEHHPFPVTLAVGRKGDAFLGTSFRGQVNLGAGPMDGEGDGSLWEVDIALARRNRKGELLWAKTFTGPGISALGGMAAKGADHLVLAGTFDQRLNLGGTVLAHPYPSGFVAELDGAGKPVWTRPLLLDDLAMVDMGPVTVDRAGGVIVSGAHEGTMDLGGISHDSGGELSFVARFDDGGAPLWARTIGTSTDDRIKAIAVDAAGDIVAAEDSAKGYLMWVTRLDADGARLFRKRIRGTVSDVVTPYALAALGSGESILAGHATGLGVTAAEDLDLGPGGEGCFVVKLDAAGAVVWAQRFERACFKAVSVDDEGRIVLGGSLSGTEQIGGKALTSDVERPLLVELDGHGKLLWSKLAEGSGAGRAEAIGVDALGRVLSGGTFQDTLDFGGGPLTTGGDDGAYFLTLLAP